jgi:hypothetical protein
MRLRYQDDKDSMYHCTIHYHKDGMDLQKTFYLRASPEQTRDSESAESCCYFCAQVSGLKRSEIDNIVMVRVPVEIPYINNVQLLGE